MNSRLTCFLLIGLILFASGCGHLAYLGKHGASIKQTSSVHADIDPEDARCLECHHPDNAQGPITPHPNFTGCLKCHND